MDKLTRIVYRSTLRTALKLDSRPALQALIHRNLQQDLPEDFHSVLSVFLQGPYRRFYVPSVLPGPTVAQTIRDAFRFPPGPPNIDSGLVGMRFLSGILQLAEKHGVLPQQQQPHTRIHAKQPQVRLQATPEQACLLVSHPLLYSAHFSNFFHQTVVLLCQHSLASGTYGLILNRLMSKDARAVVADLIGDSSSSAGDSSVGKLDLARDLPDALQAVLDHASHNGSEEQPVVDISGAKLQDPSLSSSDDDLSFEASASSDSDADAIDVTFSTSESLLSPSQQPSASTESLSGTSYPGEPGNPSLDQKQQPEHIAGAQHLSGSAEQSSQGLAAQADGNDSVTDTQQELASSSQPPLQGAGSSASAPSSSQGHDQLVWQGRIKSPAKRDQMKSRQSKQSTPGAAGDIADPRHPLRFHQVMSSLCRSGTPLDPLTAPQTPQAPPAAKQDSAPQQAAASPDTAPKTKAHQLPGAENTQVDSQSSPAGTRRSDSASGASTEYAKVDTLNTEQREDEHQGGNTGTAHLAKHSGMEGSFQLHRDSTNTGSGRGSGRAEAQGQGDLLKLMADPGQGAFLSRGGPVPSSQILHSQAELGGEAVVELSSSCPGLFVGVDNERVRQVKAAGKLSTDTLRFFVGESVWGSLQLEQELARGEWLLMSADRQLLQQLALQPHNFSNRSDHDTVSHDALRSSLRQGMWQNVLAKTSTAIADLSKIPKALVKELQYLKY